MRVVPAAEDDAGFSGASAVAFFPDLLTLWGCSCLSWANAPTAPVQPARHSLAWQPISLAVAFSSPSPSRSLALSLFRSLAPRTLGCLSTLRGRLIRHLPTSESQCLEPEPEQWPLRVADWLLQRPRQVQQTAPAPAPAPTATAATGQACSG